jgi:hypothetical protein
MLLKKYIELNNFSMRSFARAAQLSAPTIRHVVEGRDIRLSVAYTIQKITDGLVTMEEMIKPETKKIIEKKKKDADKKWNEAMEK